LFERAVGHFGELVHQVDEGQWSHQTPCTEWDVRALVNHLVYEARWAPPLLEGQTIEQVGSRFEGDLLGADPKASYDDASAGLLDAARGDGALDRTVHLSYGDTPASAYLTQLACDFVIHGWDLARAIGADGTIDADLLEMARREAEANRELLAASGLFDPVPDVPDDADAQTRTLALYGRRA
jgi:uncharacterized protein (TIGR03086 family)